MRKEWLSMRTMSDEAVAVPALPVSIAQINDFARRVGEEFGIYDENGRANLPLLLAKLGGVVEVRDGAESLVIDDDDDTFTVYVSGRTSPRRDRFTIAHEVGHLLLHHLNGDRSLRRFTRKGSNAAETQANYFAAALIMPEDHFKAAHAALDGDLWGLARQFDVSPAAAGVRCSVLGLKTAQ
ncbi:ImmA/IrrE family metallo-endopeptidase [Mycobacterium sp. SMC-19]|uniref:ImmA/IrrE family metallo-endopeptidase n=1 Tax=Mycobacterium sp. SMC-19 TaxID=3381630 RepID=UPI003877043B